MEDTKVKWATFEGWRKLGRRVKGGERSQMKNTAGQYLFSKDQTMDRVLFIPPTAADKAVEKAVEELFEVGKVYRTRNGAVRMVSERMRDGKFMISAPRADGGWYFTGIRFTDGRKIEGKEDPLDLMPGAIKWTVSEKKVGQEVKKPKQEEKDKQEELAPYDDPSAMRDAAHVSVGVVRRTTKFNNFPKDWIVERGSHDPIGYSSGKAGLERIAAMPNYWGK